ncbi:DUF2971 domain-containing protein [Endozoicomonas gorgoniicola]|uniref:DUF2971 domain-containing protein n=1 Tax=Endozoicomonas gorgoniicola TaxID=1234144 RepID=A0ABT3MQL1_9GAMM|nr:DUF2971 domain-containing protein [Endozoicomonas gorgoniicola]MCW7551666.1 DUF2971 domain-containing protein [Endozoicomonas gorgoniicola]
MKLQYNHEDEITRFISSCDALYHFTRKDTAIEHILDNQTLRFGDFKLTNDPQEYKSKMTSAIGWGWEDSHLDKIAETTFSIEKLVKSSGFISLCQNRYEDDQLVEEGCLKSRMWSQYAENHTGICLVFSKQALMQEIENQLASEHQILSDYVTYKDPSVKLTSTALSVDGYQLSTCSPEQMASDYIIDSKDHVFFQKQPDYKDENEFRIVAVAKHYKPVCGKFINFAQSLKAIILGDAFPKVYLPTIKALCEKNNVPYRKLHWEKSRYVLLQWNK